MPELQVDDLVPGPSGIRAQALDRDGSLVDDFRISLRGPVVALRNAPSPAATSRLAIAEHLVDAVLGRDRRAEPAVSTPLDHGLWVVLTTPFGADGDIDHGSLRRQVSPRRAGRARGVVALGVFGEAAALSSVEQAAVLAT